MIDDGSRKPIENIIIEFSRHINIKYSRIQNIGPAAARNKGAEIARGFYYAFIDDDCRLAHDWLDRAEKGLKRSPTALIGGRVLNRPSDNIYATTSQMVLDAAYLFYKREFGFPQFFTTNNIAVPAALFEDIGGFDARLRTAEDRDFCDRCLHKGYQLIYDPEVVVYHDHALTFRTFIDQYFAYGRGAYHFYKLRKKRGAGNTSKHMRFHFKLPGLLKNLMSELELRQKATVLALMIVWEFANTAGLIYEIYRNQKSE